MGPVPRRSPLPFYRFSVLYRWWPFFLFRKKISYRREGRLFCPTFQILNINILILGRFNGDDILILCIFCRRSATLLFLGFHGAVLIKLAALIPTNQTEKRFTQRRTPGIKRLFIHFITITSFNLNRFLKNFQWIGIDLDKEIYRHLKWKKSPFCDFCANYYPVGNFWLV